MANRYWVGNGGNWSDNTNHWASSSGGAPGVSKPTSSDNVIFDANSFSAGSQTVTINEIAYCLDMDWTGATNTPTLAGAPSLNLYGSLTFISGMTQTYSGQVFFRATATGKTITSAKPLSCYFTFDGVGGGWTLQDNLTLPNNRALSLTRGALDFNNKDVACGTFYAENSNVRGLTLGNGTITLTRTTAITKWALADITNLTFDAGASTIVNQSAATAAQAFQGGGLTYNNLTIQGSAHYVFTIEGSNTFNVLTIDRSVSAKTIKFTDGTTQTVTNLVIATSGTTVVTLQGTSTGGWTISDASGSYDFHYLTISYSTAQGGATWQALTSNNNTDGGNNSGWIFSSTTRGWMSK